MARRTRAVDPRFASPTATELAALRNAPAGAASRRTSAAAGGGAASGAGRGAGSGVAAAVGLESDLLNLEVASLVSSRKVKYSRTTELQSALFTLKTAMEACPKRDGVDAAALRKWGMAGALPLRNAHTVAPTLDFVPPSRVDIVGSFLLHTVCKPALNVDVAVEMPSSCFGRKDTLNALYTDKRALYLACLAHGLRSSAGVSKAFSYIGVQAFRGDVTKPVLVLRPADRKAAKWTVRVMPAVAPNTFEDHRLVPSRNNMRRAAVSKALSKGVTTKSKSRGAAAAAAPADDAVGEEPATPFYNAAVLEDVHPREALAAMHAVLNRSPNAVAALVALKSWLRSLDQGRDAPADGVNGFLLSAVLACLLQHNVLSPAMQAHQLVRAFLQWLAENDLSQTCLVMAPAPDDDGSDSGSDTAGAAAGAGSGSVALAKRRRDNRRGPGTGQLTTDALDAFTAAYDCVVVCPSHALNLASRVSASACGVLRRHALAAFHALKPRTSSGGSGSASAADPTGAGAFAGGLPVQLSPADAFASVFLRPQPPPVAFFDRVVGITVPSQPQSAQAGASGGSRAGAGAGAWSGRVAPVDVAALCDVPWQLLVRRRAVAVLRQALTDRALLVASVDPAAGVAAGSIAPSALSTVDGSDDDDDDGSSPSTRAQPVLAGAVQWPLDGAVPDATHVAVGLLLRQTASDRILDKGPAADDKRAADAFKAFWGAKSELRRFQDGSIVEAVVWDVPQGRRYEVVPAIVRYALQRHLPVEAEDIAVPSADVEAVLDPPGRTPSQVATTRALSAFEKLATALTEAPGMPLAVAGVDANSPALRYTSLYPVAAHPFAGGDWALATAAGASRVSQVVEPINVVVTLEPSARWPDDVNAIRHTKTAFYLKFKYGLQKGSKIRSVPAREWLDAFVDGYAFRIRLYHERELLLLRRAAARAADGGMGTSVGVGGVADVPDVSALGFVNVAPIAAGAARPMAQRAKRRRDGGEDEGQRAAAEADALHRDCVQRTRHATVVHGLAHRFAAYGPTVRMARMWLAAHLLSDHLAVEAVELLVGHLFVCPYPLSPPRTAAVGFLRFLGLLASHDWADAALLVDLEAGVAAAAAADDSAVDLAGDVAKATAAARAAEARAATGAGAGSRGAAVAASEARALDVRFRAVRSHSGASGGAEVSGPAMYLVTPHDRGAWRAPWTESSPSPIVLRRMVALAQRCASVVAAWLQHDGCFAAPAARIAAPWATAFTTPTGDFDALIHLRQSQLPRCDGLLFELPVPRGGGAAALLADDGSDDDDDNGAAAASPTLIGAAGAAGALAATSGLRFEVPLARNLARQGRDALLVGFDPVGQYLQELTAAYGSRAMFFRNPRANDAIAVAWRRDQPGSRSPSAALERVGHGEDASGDSDSDVEGAAVAAHGKRSRKDGRKGKGAEAAGVGVGAGARAPDALAMMRGFSALGAGIVEKVVLAPQLL